MPPGSRRPGKESRSRRIYAHVAVHGQPPAGLCIGWLAGASRASERASPWMVLVAHWHWRAHVLVLALGRWGCWSSAFAGALPIAEDFSACLLVLVQFPGLTTSSATVGLMAWTLERGRVPKNCHNNVGLPCHAESARLCHCTSVAAKANVPLGSRVATFMRAMVDSSRP
jgi:hypothetical protein